MKILQENDSPLLDRKSLVLEMEYSKGPTLSRTEIRKKIAEKFKVAQNLVAIQEIKTKFGGKFLKITCNIYKDEKLLKYLEVKKKKEQAAKPAEGEANGGQASQAA